MDSQNIDDSDDKHQYYKFTITDNIKNAGIIEISINKLMGFIFSLADGRKFLVPFYGYSIFQNLKEIKKKVKLELKLREIDKNITDGVLSDIENELIANKDTIFNINNNSNESKNNESADQKQLSVIERIRETRKKANEEQITEEKWRSVLLEKYNYLHNLTLELMPELWLPLEFVISTKSILNIKDWSLPFMAVILAPPLSMKTVALDMLIGYPFTFTTDEFSPSSFVTHMSGLPEEELRKRDMLPRMTNKISIFPELAPLFTSKDEDLQKNFGKILRILDGKGFQSDSGAQGHRGYSGEMMLVILGAAVEIPYKVYKMFGNLGQKIYYFRLPRVKKTRDERKEALKLKNDFKNKTSRIKNALIDYLIWFDSPPEILSEIDGKTGLAKFYWDTKREDEKESDKVIGHLVDLGELLAHLRGVVNTFNSTYTNNGNNRKPEGNLINNSRENQDSENRYQKGESTDGNNERHYFGPVLNFDNDIPIIEEPSRAITHLKSLAMGHAISQGRNYLTLRDLPIVIKLALSTASISRVTVFDLLLEHKGELTTSDIVNGLRVSPQTALRVMAELHALEVVDRKVIGTYGNSGYKITLKERYRWFTTDEFKKLREGFKPEDYSDELKKTLTKEVTESNEETASSINSDSKENRGMNQNSESHDQSCDGHGHTHSQFSGVEEGKNFKNYNREGNTHELKKTNYTDIKNNDNCNFNGNTNYIHKGNEVNEDVNINSSNNNVPLLSTCKYHKRVTGSHEDEITNEEETQTSPLPFPPNLPLNQEEQFALQKVLDEIKNVDGLITVNAAIQSAYDKDEQVREILGERITQRENKKIRKICLAIVRHPNVTVKQNKPQIIVKWDTNNFNTEQNQIVKTDAEIVVKDDTNLSPNQVA